MLEKRAVAFDINTSSGHVVIGSFDGERISLQEVYRFPNEAVSANGNTYWDILKIFSEIKKGLLKANEVCGFDTIGIDTWGSDYGLIDKYGKLIHNPFHYTDRRTNGMVGKAKRFITAENLYRITGNKISQINTIFQIMSDTEKRPYIFDNASIILPVPDLLNYMLTGNAFTEYSAASTMQLLNCQKKVWATEVMNALSIKKEVFPQILECGTEVGNVLEEVCAELGIPASKVVAVCGNSMQSAVAGIPALEKDFVFINCGLLSTFGTELENPVASQKAMDLNFTNEFGYAGTVDFFKNTSGLWIIHKVKRAFAELGENISIDEIHRIVLEQPPLRCIIDPDDSIFLTDGSIIEKIQQYCGETNQYVPVTIGEVMRCVYESIALKYSLILEEIKSFTEKDYNTIHIIGVGSCDKFLCQMIADACDTNVVAGAVNSSVYGNIAVQLIEEGSISDISLARRIISESCETVTYQPMSDYISWHDLLESFYKKDA